jgi:putative endonuclease
MADPTSREQGLFAETLVLKHLQTQGLRLVTHNYQLKLGEIDLIMREGEILVFIEVRARENFDEIHPFETVTKAKQGRIISTAKHYLWTHDLLDTCPCRFDVVAVNLSSLEIDWVKDAFY